MYALLLAAVLPGLFWKQGPETVPALQRAGIECVTVPAGQAPAWQKSGFCHTAVNAADIKSRQKLPAPGVRFEINLASATRSPWVDWNGWHIARGGRFLYTLPRGKASLAAAEAFVYGADALLEIDPADLEPLGRMLAFLKRVSRPDDSALQPLANFCIADDGSDVVGEVMNLLGRHNLLYRIVSAAPAAGCDLHVQVGSPRYPKSEAADPVAFVDKLRRELTDEKRLVRVYGADVVLARLTGGGSRLRLHLLNYGEPPIEGVRLRVLESFAKGDLFVAGKPDAKLEDYEIVAGATEFTISEMGPYAVVDLYSAQK